MLKQEGIIKMSLYLMEFIQEISYLKKKQDGVYMLNFDEYADVGCYFNSSGVEYVPKEIEKFIRHKNKNSIYNMWILLHWIHWSCVSR